MAFPFYLARTAAEFSAEVPDSPDCAWMACHFSSYGTGLSNLPAQLPEGAMIILNDRIPVCGHDPEVIFRQLRELVSQLKPGCILLDFQRPEEPQTERIAAALAGLSDCPVGISELYAPGLSCPVFLPPPPLDIPLADYLLRWKGRELWLEAAMECATITVTEAGSRYEPLPFSPPPEDAFHEPKLHCHYRTQIDEDAVTFHLYRTLEDLNGLLSEAESLGVTRAAGLYQQLGAFARAPL